MKTLRHGEGGGREGGREGGGKGGGRVRGEGEREGGREALMFVIVRLQLIIVGYGRLQ